MVCGDGVRRRWRQWLALAASAGGIGGRHRRAASAGGIGGRHRRAVAASASAGGIG